MLSLYTTAVPASPNEWKSARPINRVNKIKQKPREVLVQFKASASSGAKANAKANAGISETKNSDLSQAKILQRKKYKKSLASYKRIKRGYKKKRNRYVRAIRRYRALNRKKRLSKSRKKRLKSWRIKVRRLNKRWKSKRKRYIRKFNKLKRAPEVIELLKTGPNTSISNAVAKLKANKNVRYAEPNHIIGAQYTPNDALYASRQWGFNNTSQLIWGYKGKADADIDAPEAWNIERGNARPVVVAVTDTGIDFAHPDAPKIWQNTGEVDGNGIDDDNNGVVDDVNGYNWSGISQTSATTQIDLGATDVGNEQIYQSIVGTGRTMSSAAFLLVKYGRPFGSINVYLKSVDPTTGPTLAQFTINEWEVDDYDFSEVEKNFNNPVTLTNGQTYYLVLEPVSSDPSYDTYWATNYYSLGAAEMWDEPHDDYYIQGRLQMSDNDGASWTDGSLACSNSDCGDLYFKTNANPYPADDDGHGTHVSGIIGAKTNNAAGVAGVSPGSTIMPLKVLGADGSGTIANLIAAIGYATNNGARIINMSLGTISYSVLLEKATTNAFKEGLVLVAAAGNSGDGTKYYPAANKNVISVSATNNRDQLAYFSTRNTQVDVSAPGHAISSTTPYSLTTPTGLHPIREYYDFMSGTSMAAPMVSGTAALLRSEKPRFTAKQVSVAVSRLSDDLGKKGYDTNFGYGRLNANKALRGDKGAPRRLKISSSTHKSSRRYYSRSKPRFNWSAFDATGVAGYNFVLDRKRRTNPKKKIRTGRSSKSYKRIRGGTAYFHLRATDSFNNWSRTKHFGINIDNYKPRTIAPRSTVVTKGATARLYYRVNDRYSAGRVKVTIKVKKGSKTYKNLRLGWVRANRLNSTAFRAKLNSGTYKFYIYASDKAGNKQRNIARAKLTITVKPKGPRVPRRPRRPVFPGWPVSP